MKRIALRSQVATFALAALVTAGLSAAPWSLSGDLSLDSKLVQAKGNGGDKGGKGGGRDGGGNGGGNGGGKGGGNGAGKDTASADSEDASPGKSKGHDAKSKGGLGSLSASNASATAREHAAANSQVGKMRDYEEAMANGDLEAAAEALASAANKDITPEVVNQVNRNMGIESTLTDEEVAAAAAAKQQEAASEGDDLGDDGTEDEVDEIAQAVDDLMGDGGEEETAAQ